MGRQIYLTAKEIIALADTAGEWCDVMSQGEDTAKDVDSRLKNGLGSALYKLYNNEEGKRIYSKYIKGDK